MNQNTLGPLAVGHPVTRADVERHVGLWTNGMPYTKDRYRRNLGEAAIERCQRMERARREKAA